MKPFLLFFSTLLFATDLYIAAAANLKGALPHLIELYKKNHPNVNIHVKYGTSGELKEEILKTKKYDLFLSANKYFPDEIYSLSKKFKPKIYAKGILTVVSRKKFKYKDFRKVLLNANCIVIADPSKAPYGKASIEAINNLWILSEVEKKIVYARNVADVIPHLKKCDVGIISKSLKEKLKNQGLYFLDIPLTSYYPIEQSVILLSDKKEAVDFYHFLFTKEAKEIFKKYGYITE